jgi:N,N'-diacetylchitobiose transport system permease protein
MVPLNALIIPLYLMLDQVGQTDSLPGVIAVYLAVVLPFMIWTLRGCVARAGRAGGGGDDRRVHAR